MICFRDLQTFVKNKLFAIDGFMSNSQKHLEQPASNRRSKEEKPYDWIDHRQFILYSNEFEIMLHKMSCLLLTKQSYGSSTLFIWNLLDNGNCHSGSDAGGNGVFLPSSTNHVYASKKGFSFLHTSNKNGIPQRIKSVEKLKCYYQKRCTTKKSI